MSAKVRERHQPQKAAPAEPLTPVAKLPIPEHSAPPAVERYANSRRTDVSYDSDEEEEEGFLRRNRVLIAVGAIGAALAAYAAFGPSSEVEGPVTRAAVPINIQIAPPPPPPPPPPPKVEPPRDEEMELQPDEEDAPPEPEPDTGPAPITTNNVGDGGPDAFNLGKAGARRSGTGTGRRLGSGGSRFGDYAAQVQNSIASAMRRNSKTKSANLAVTARIWTDQTGRVTRAKLNGSTGDPAVDSALQNEVLTGLQLDSPPPVGMKMPINLRLTARSAL